MDFSQKFVPPTQLVQAVAENCDWSAVAEQCGASLSAQECESLFLSLFGTAKSAVTSVPKSEITVTELPEEIKQEPISVAKPKVAPKPPQQFTIVDSNKKRVRRKATQIKRLFRCIVSGCSRSYGTEGALKMHLKLKHPDVTYDPMNPPVVLDTISNANSHNHRHDEDEDDNSSSSSSIDDLNCSPPSTPLPLSNSVAPQSPTSGYDFHKSLPMPAGLPQINAILPSPFSAQQPMFNPQVAHGFPHMMPPMYGGYRMPAPWPAASLPPQPLPMALPFPDAKKRAAPEIDAQLTSQPKRIKTAEADVLSTLVSLRSH